MKFDGNRIRQRREQRIREITEQIENVPLPQILHEMTEKMPSKRLNRFLLQMLLSLFILGAVVAIDRSEIEWWENDARSFTEDALTEDYDFAGTATWIEQRFGQFPSLLPTVQLFKSKEVIPVLSPPLNGTIVESFSPAFTGIIIETGVAEEVHPIGPGWVRAIEKKKGMGTVIVIQHADSLESSYGFLGKAFVKKNDWVYPDSVIGVVGEQSLFLQIRDKKAFIDPMDVVPFE